MLLGTGTCTGRGDNDGLTREEAEAPLQQAIEYTALRIGIPAATCPTRRRETCIGEVEAGKPPQEPAGLDQAGLLTFR